MLSKCIRRLSFRSIADDKPLKKQDDNNNMLQFPLHAPTPVKPNPSPMVDTTNTWTSALWNLSPRAGRRQCSGFDTSSVPMLCRCILIPCGDGEGMGRFILSVVLSRANGRVYRGEGEQGEVVASSMVARNIKPGSLQFQLRSPVLELDPDMDSELLKVEPNWSGADVEKQYILRAKSGQSVHGLLGKVTVEQSSQGHRTPLFELTMVSKKQHQTTGNLAWGAAGFRELASLLNLVDENDDFTCLAKDLGFTDHELSTKLLPSSDPFAALLATYQSRGGTPTELVRAMYSCSRVRGLGVTGGSPTPLGRAISQCSTLSQYTCTTPAHGTWVPQLEEELEHLEEAAMLRVRTSSGGRKRKLSEAKSGSLKRIKVEEQKEEEEEEGEDDDFCDAATIPVVDLEQGVNQAHLPPTPPATPLKRLTGSQGSKELLRQGNVFSYPVVA